MNMKKSAKIYFSPHNSIKSEALAAKHRGSFIGKTGAFIEHTRKSISPYMIKAGGAIEDYSKKLGRYQKMLKTYPPEKRDKQRKKSLKRRKRYYESPFESNAVEFGGIGDMNIEIGDI